MSSEHILVDISHKAHFWEAHTHKPFNERQRAIITRLFDGFEGQRTSSKWARLANCSQDAALRDIDDLEKPGVLVKEPGRGRGTCFAQADRRIICE